METVNITYEVEKARRSNYKDLFSTLRDETIKSRMHDIGLMVDIMNGDIDKQVIEHIDTMLKNGEIDGMYQYIY